MEAVTITQITPPELETLIENSLRKILSVQKQETHPEPDPLLTIQQAAEFLKLSVPTIYSLVSRSEIPVSKKTKRLYFSRKELTDWIKTGRRKTISEVEAEADSFLQLKTKRS